LPYFVATCITISFKKDTPDLRDPATMYLLIKYNLKLKTIEPNTKSVNFL
jgi:hypothetical protein